MLPLIFIASGVAALGAFFIFEGSSKASGGDYTPDYPPDPTLGKTGYKKVDAILPLLKKASDTSGIPLGLLVAWVIHESRGHIGETTSMDERGVFQLSPDESKSLGLDHKRLSTDMQYSIDGGIQAITRKYRPAARALGVAPEGSSYFWLLTKAGHTMGSGQTKKIVESAKSAGEAGSWAALEKHALGMSINGPQPKKWFPFLDKIYHTGLPWGFGSDAGASMVGADFDLSDLSDNETQDLLARALESRPPLDEKQAVAWVCRNRARVLGTTVGAMLKDGYIATDKTPSDISQKVAKAVLALPDDADPTDGAIDYFCPAEQDYYHNVSIAHRAAVVAGDEEGECEPIDSADDVRDQYASAGLRTVAEVGELELMGIA